MQLNFLGLILVGVGVVALGLGISGNYKAFGQSVAKSVSGKERIKKPPHE